MEDVDLQTAMIGWMESVLYVRKGLEKKTMDV